MLQWGEVQDRADINRWETFTEKVYCRKKVQRRKEGVWEAPKEVEDEGKR